MTKLFLLSGRNPSSIAGWIASQEVSIFNERRLMCGKLHSREKEEEFHNDFWAIRISAAQRRLASQECK